MQQRLYTPQAIAMFSVKVAKSHAETLADAQRITDRYLYAGARFALTGGTDHDSTHWFVQVQGSSDASRDDLQRRVQDQRDRLASGMHYTTEPVYFVRED